MRKTMAIAAVGLLGLGTYAWRTTDHAPVAQEHDTTLLKDRVWIDHMPKNDRDTMQLFVALTQRPRQGPPGPIGVFEAISAWQGRFEAFRYESHGEEMRIIFPQTGDRETLTVKPSKCNENGMDFCLEVEGSSRGVKRYYSRKGWEVRTVDEAEALVTKLK